MHIRHIAVLSLALSFLASGAARAQQRPLVTEDPETIGAGRVLVEGGVELAKNQVYPLHGIIGDTTHGPTLGVSVGVGPSAEVQLDGELYQRLSVTDTVITPLPNQIPFADTSAASVGDFIVATKIRIVSESDTRPAFGLRFGTKLPTAAADKGIGLGTTDFFASLLVAKTVESVRTVGNVGLLFLGNPINGREPVHALGMGVSVARALTNAFELVGEVNGRLDPMGDTVEPGTESRGAIRLAGRYTHQLLRFDVGMVIGVTPRDPNFGISAGATYVIGR